MAKKALKLIGYPLEHSVSPNMQNAALKVLKLDNEFAYSLEPIKPEELRKKVTELKTTETAGFNVTIPYKEAIIPLLDEVDPTAQLIKAVNTVINKDGRLIGFNTDGPGFIESLKKNRNAPDITGKNVMILGAGGASRAVAVMLAAAGVKSISISEIQAKKAHDLLKHISENFNSVLTTFVEPNSAELQSAIDDAVLLVNTTPVGMTPNIEASPLPENIKLHSNLFVYDLVYNPEETKLLKSAADCKGRASGLEMLIQQGALAFSIWTGKAAPIETMRQAAKAALKLS